MAVTVEDVRWEYGDTEEPYYFPDSKVQATIDEAVGLLQRKGISSDRVVRFQAALDLLDIRIRAIKQRLPNAITEGKKSVSYTDLVSLRNLLSQKLESEICTTAGCFDISYNI